MVAGTLVAYVLVYATLILAYGSVLFYLARKKNLVRPMWTGDKLLPAAVPAALDHSRSRWLALAVAAACAALVTWIVGLGG